NTTRDSPVDADSRRHGGEAGALRDMADLESRFIGYASEQLRGIFEDDEELQKIVRDSEEILELQHCKQLMLVSNLSLAEQNLNLQPQLEEQKLQLRRSYSSLQEKYQELMLRRSMLGNCSLDTLLAVLQTEGAKIEEETENMADSFLDGLLPLENFIDDYQSRRKLAHLRRVKIDKLQEMLLKGLCLPSHDTLLLQEDPAGLHRDLYSGLSNGSPVPTLMPPYSEAPSAGSIGLLQSSGFILHQGS
ncbi:hypothetical protein DNTS_017521, partial [Danionella cerebrum]